MRADVVTDEMAERCLAERADLPVLAHVVDVDR